MHLISTLKYIMIICAMFTMLLELQHQKSFSKTHCCCCITGLCTSHRQGEIELDINWKLFRVLDVLKWFVVFLSCDFLRSTVSLIYFTVHWSLNLTKPNASMTDVLEEFIWFQNAISLFAGCELCRTSQRRLVQSMAQPRGNGMQLWSLKLHWSQYLQRASDIS